MADQPITIESLLEQQSPPRDESGRRTPPSWASAALDTATARPAAPAPADRPAFLSEGGFAHGAFPSTFEQQAANLARGQPPVETPPALRGTLPPAPRPAMAAAAPAAGGFQIQIGAYQSEVEAQRQLALVSGRLPAVLGDRVPLSLQARQGTKLIYRARYAGFAAQAAATGACSEIKRLKLDCIVVKGD